MVLLQKSMDYINRAKMTRAFVALLFVIYVTHIFALSLHIDFVFVIINIFRLFHSAESVLVILSCLTDILYNIKPLN